LSFGVALGLAIACSDDSSDGDDDDDNPSTSGTTGSTINSNATITSAAIGMGTATSGSPTNMTATASTATGTTGGLGGSAGSAGAGGACEPDPSSGLPTDGVDGVAGGGGAPGAGYDEGFHFTDPDSVAAWRIKPVEDCPECIPDATLEAGCGTMLMTANWPEEANTGSLKSTAELNATGDERWDLSGATVTVRARWASGGDTDNNGFDAYLELLDDDWTFLGLTLGESFDAGDTYLEWAVQVPAEAEADFDPATVRQINVRFDTKFWTDEEMPPTFNYDTTVFEIDAVVW
jgi:hypothetical protein